MATMSISFSRHLLGSISEAFRLSSGRPALQLILGLMCACRASEDTPLSEQDETCLRNDSEDECLQNGCDPLAVLEFAEESDGSICIQPIPVFFECRDLTDCEDVSAEEDAVYCGIDEDGSEISLVGIPGCGPLGFSVCNYPQGYSGACET